MKSPERMLRAVNELLAYYEGRIKVSDFWRCPLCATVVFCDDCPWKVFEKMRCGQFAYTNYQRYYPQYKDKIGYDSASLTSHLRMKSRAWRKRRIPMLKRWRRKLRTEIRKSKRT